MAAGDLSDFQVVGRALARLGLVRGSEGNLSTFDGRVVRITRTGAALDALTEADVLDWTPESPAADVSSDLEKHLRLIGERGARAVVHAHPPHSVPEGWTEGEPHGVYAHGLTLEQALAAAVLASEDREPARGRPDEDVVVGSLLAVELEAAGPSARRAGVPGALRLLDQRALPARETHLRCETVEEVADAIRRLAVRGAPVLGIAAAYGMVLAAGASEGLERDRRLERLRAAADVLAATRPTAVNIRWAVERVLSAARAEPVPGDLAAAALREARRIEAEDAAACSSIGRFGAELVPERANVLTHCNTGMLCTAGIGTAQGVIYRAHIEGKGIHVWVDETRPVWQGARLTAWEFGRLRVPFTLVADAAAASLLAAGRVDLVVTGADRIAADGSVANKVGTYGLAVLARHHGVPFCIAAPTSTIDPWSASGADIEIEQRDPREVTAPFGLAVAPEGTPASNPAFDVTPPELVTAIVTERGVVRAPYASGLREVRER